MCIYLLGILPELATIKHITSQTAFIKNSVFLPGSSPCT